MVSIPKVSKQEEFEDLVKDLRDAEAMLETDLQLVFRSMKDAQISREEVGAAKVRVEQFMKENPEINARFIR